MGGIKEHRQGIQITFYWNGVRYRPTLKIPYTPANRKYAERLKAEIERAIGLGQYTLEQYAKHFPTSRLAREAPKTEGRIPTFGEMADRWLPTCSQLSVGTLIKYNQALSFWRRHLADVPVDEIKYSTLATLANNQQWGAKNRNNILIPLRQVMELAVMDEIIKINPAERLKNGKVQKEPPDPLTAEEVESVLQHLTRYDAQIVNLFEFSFFTGMRPSELIALRWGDIDQRRGTARVQRARTFGVEHPTKTYEIRDVELNSRAKGALLRQKSHTFLKESGYVFENPVTGEPYSEERPLRRAYWNPTLKMLGLRERVFYQTRHTYATLNLMAGANPMWVAKQMGHQNMNMILTVYARWIDGADKSRELMKIDALFSATATKPPPAIANNS